MRQIIDDLRGLDTEHAESDLALTREAITSAVVAHRLQHSDSVRTLLEDDSYEQARVALMKALVEDPAFQDHIKGRRVTFGMIKPNVNEAKSTTDLSDDETAEAITMAIDTSLELLAQAHTRMPKPLAEDFYAHLASIGDGTIFRRVTEFMSSGAITGMFLFSENDAIDAWRQNIGATNPANAEPGTIRRDFADNIENNVVHGSDSPESVQIEIRHFMTIV